MNLRHIVPGLLLLAWSGGGAWAQSQSLSLDEAVALAKQNNNQVLLASNNTQQAQAQYRQTDAVFLPQVNLSYTAMTSNNPLNAFGFKLQQQSITQNDFNPALLNHPDNASDFMTRAMLQQPVFNADMLYQRKAARAQIAVAGLQEQRTKDYVAFQVRSEFMQLQLSYEVVKVLEEALTTAKAMYKFMDDRYQQGYLQKSDLLNAEVQLKATETQLAGARSSIKDHCDNLSLLTGKPVGAIYVVDSLVPLALPGDAGLPDNRADFVAMHKAMDAYSYMISSTRMSAVPKINGFASYQLNDPELTGFHNNSYLAGVQLSWNIFQGNMVRSTVKKQKLQLEQTSLQLAGMKSQGSTELAAARRKLADAAYQIAQTKTSVQQAQEALDILQNRYRQGLAGTTDLLMAQTQLAQQQLAYQQAVMMQNMTIAYIELLTAH